MSDYGGRLIRDTEPTVNTTSASGIWTIEEALKYKKAGTWPTPVYADPNFKQTVLLLHGDGTNGAQNNTFLDSSSNNFTITRNGNTTQGTFSPFSVGAGEWSNYFDGTGDWLSVADNAAFTMGSGDFTIEYWTYFLGGADLRVYGQFASSLSLSTISFFGGSSAGNKVLNGVYSGTTGYTCTSSADMPTNQWVHIAFVRDGNTLRQYINGVQDGISNVTGVSINDSSTQLSIGRPGEYAAQYWNGYISNFRIVKGTCVYPSGTTFTPPASLTAITNTSLLTCQSNRFVDNSTNNFAITRNGDVRVTPFSPFAPSAAYSAGTNGGSGYFDGSGDYLSGIGTTSSFNFLHNTSALFTVQAWVYLPVGGSSRVLIDTTGNSGSNIGVVINTNTSNQLAIVITRGTAGSFVLVGNSTGSLVVGAWNHVAITYDQSLGSNNAVFYINGVQSGTQSKTGNTPSSSNATYALACGGSATGGEVINGYIANLRIDNSIESITLPTTPLSTVTNTKLLLNFTNAGIIDNTGKNNLETVGNAQIDTAVKKYGTGSLEFDGSGDYLVAPSSSELTLNADFTIEGWAYVNASGNYRFLTLGDSASATGIEIYFGNGSWLVYSNNATRITGSAVVREVWIHLAVVRSGSTVTLYVNGSASGSTWSSSASFSGRLFVGAEFYNNSLLADTNGYIDDLRITKGVARYTANFTAPTAPFLDQ